MKDNSYSVHIMYQIWDDELGSRIEVGADKDGDELISIRSRNDIGNVEAQIIINEEQLVLLIDSLCKYKSFLDTNKYIKERDGNQAK